MDLAPPPPTNRLECIFIFYKFKILPLVGGKCSLFQSEVNNCYEKMNKRSYTCPYIFRKMGVGVESGLFYNVLTFFIG